MEEAEFGNRFSSLRAIISETENAPRPRGQNITKLRNSTIESCQGVPSYLLNETLLWATCLEPGACKTFKLRGGTRKNEGGKHQLEKNKKNGNMTFATTHAVYGGSREIVLGTCTEEVVYRGKSTINEDA